MKKLLLFFTLIIAGFSLNAQYTPYNQLNYIKLLKIPPIGLPKDSVLVFDSSDGFVKMRPLSALTVINHNDTEGIQGGAVGDYQHVTTTEKTNWNGKANLLGGNSFTGVQAISEGLNTARYSLLPIRNNFGAFFNQPFYQSDKGYFVFQPTEADTPARFYIMAKGSPASLGAKFEIFNKDYAADFTNYEAFNILLNNSNDQIDIGPNRGSGGGSRQKMRIGGDYVGSGFTANASAIDFNTDNTININPFGGAISFGSALVDPFGLGLANEFSFKNFTTGQPSRLNIIGNGWAAGVYFGRDAIRTASIATQATTSDVEVAVNKTNTGTALTSMIRIWGATGNVTLQDGGTHTDNGVDRLKITGSAIATAWKTSGGASTDYVTGTGSLVNFNSGVRTATLTGFTSGAGTVTASDTVLQAIQKLDGNISAYASSGTYTPTFVAGSNATSVVLFKSATYTKNGNIVNVRVDFTCNFTTSNVATSFTMSLPFNRATSTNMFMGTGSAAVNSAGNSVLSVICQSINTDKVNISTLPIGGSAFSGLVVLQYSTLD